MLRNLTSVGTFRWSAPSRVVVLLLAAVAVAISLLGGALPADVSAQLDKAASCHGDETLSFAPAQPIAGDLLLIAATSSREHPGVWLAGPGRPQAFRAYAGQLGHVWNFLVPTRNPGVYRFQFYVDSTILCAEVEVTVVPSVTSTALPATSVAEVGSTQTRVPSLVRDVGDNADNGSDGDNDNDAEDGDNDSADNGDNGDNEAAIREPSIQSLSSESLCPGSTLRIEGRGFGDQQSAVGGSIVIGNAQVRDYLSWTDREIVVLVPNSAVPGENRQLFVITDGGFDESELEVADSGCQEDNEAALRTPTIQSLSSERLCPGTTLRIEGRGFGEQRSAAGGSIVIGNAQVRDYLSWTDRAIVVLVPTSAVPGENRLFIVTDGGFDESELEVADSGCSEAPPAQPAPSVRSVDPSQVCAQSVLVIRGAGFGESRSALQGKVVIGGAEVRDYLAWRDNQLTVLVPAGANAGTQQRLYVLTIAGFDDIQIQIDSPPC